MRLASHSVSCRRQAPGCVPEWSENPAAISPNTQVGLPSERVARRPQTAWCDLLDAADQKCKALRLPSIGALRRISLKA